MRLQGGPRFLGPCWSSPKRLTPPQTPGRSPLPAGFDRRSISTAFKRARLAARARSPAGTSSQSDSGRGAAHRYTSSQRDAQQAAPQSVPWHLHGAWGRNHGKWGRDMRQGRGQGRGEDQRFRSV